MTPHQPNIITKATKTTWKRHHVQVTYPGQTKDMAFLIKAIHKNKLPKCVFMVTNITNITLGCQKNRA